MLLQTIQLSAKELHLDFPQRPEPWLTSADVMRASALNLAQGWQNPPPSLARLQLAPQTQLREALEWLANL